MTIDNIKKTFFIIASIIVLYGCSSTKYVPDGKYLLNSVNILSDQKDFEKYDYLDYIRQTPNTKWFSWIKVPLYIYDLSGRDSTKRFNRMLKRIGDAPVIYDEQQTLRTKNELTNILNNMGYMSANVYTTTQTNHKKIDVTYHIVSGKPYRISSINKDIKDSLINKLFSRDSAASLLHAGMRLDINTLEAERTRITKYLTSNGFYQFNKEYISYSADTVKNSKNVDLTIHIAPYKTLPNGTIICHKQFSVKSVSFVTDYNPLHPERMSSEKQDSIIYKGYPIIYKNKIPLRPNILFDNNYITKGDLYNESLTQKTYSAINKLSALKYTAIKYDIDPVDSTALNCEILMNKAKPQSISFELEGTNSEGDLGMAAAISTQHRNLFHGSEDLTIKLKGDYEAISGLQDSKYNNYTEYSVETNLNFPRFLLPFAKASFRKNVKANSALDLQYDYQQSPEYSRNIFSGAWSYKWYSDKNLIQHRLDVINVSYTYLPWISTDFKNNYLQNSILEYNYNDQLIAGMNYSLSYSNIDPTKLLTNSNQNSYTIRFNVESAGNMLYAMSKIFNIRRNSDNRYAILDIGYEQYIKTDLDYAKKIIFDKRNALAFHGAFGIGVPYGNASQLPFIKRYFSGGANSVRGWLVRELGPGTYKGNEDVDFMNKSGDIKLDGSVEYRSKLFWHFCGAAFVDAGNIWTIKNYVGQEGGVFRFDKFYKQIAVAYGLGLRLDFQYFVLRFDGGMKAINPAYTGKEQFPFYHPSLHRDFAFHFAVGYPF